MGHVKSYTITLGVKLLVAGAVIGGLRAYFVVNPSMPDVLAYLTGGGGVFLWAYLILSTVDSMMATEYRLAE